MKYHNYDGVAKEKMRQLKKFPRKPQHSIAPDSAEKQFRVLQRHYPQLKSVQRRLFAQSEVVKLPDDAVVEVRSGEFDVTAHGRKRTFGLHETRSKDGKRQVRAYPKAGDGVRTFSGSTVFNLVQAYNSSSTTLSFEEFVIEEVKKFSSAGGTDAASTLTAPADVDGDQGPELIDVDSPEDPGLGIASDASAVPSTQAADFL